MHGEFARDSASNSEPLPPARTRWAEEAGNGPGAGSLLGPVRSGRLESFAAEPAFTEEEAVPEPASIDAAEWEALEEEPTGWDEVGAEKPATDGFVMEVEPGSEFELTFDAENVELIVETGDDQLTIVEDFATPPDVHVPVQPIEREQGRPTPLSAWDLAAHSTGAAEKARRAREEWDSLEQALVRSLDTSAESRTTAEGAVRPHAVSTELEELARRLEQFAAALRTDGTRAMEMAQSRGDPIDVVLAAIAAGYISGRRE
jgi:hypothetical protein